MRHAPTTHIDIMADATAADPWPLLHAVRAQGPAVWHEEFGRWMVGVDRAVRKVLTDFHHFTVEGTTVEDLFGADAFISMDDRRRHDDLRNIWAESFRKQGLDRLIPAVRRTVDTLLDPLAERLRAGEAVDVTEAVCRPLPTVIICLMMGLPEDGIADVVRWSDAMAAGGATYLSGEDALRARQAREDAKDALADYLGGLLKARQKAPGDDIISTLAVSPAGRALADSQLVQNLRQLLFAGNETTAKWLANLLLTYGEKPEVQRELAQDRALIPQANDEVMRWQTVVGTLVRRVRGGPVDLLGVQLEDGDDVTLLLGAANRDPDRYPDPDRFDIHRAAKPNLGFGMGFHNCLGSMLAKLEAQTAVNGLLDRVDGFVVSAPYHYSSMPLRGPLPVVIARS